MSLESCMIVLDCSEYMRNGDYIPTRLGAQLDAANLLISAKTQFHAESTVGVSAGTELLVSPRTKQHMATILSSMQGLSLKEPSSQWSGDVTAAIQVASLALKHRPNKNGSQRIILFVGSPLTTMESRVLQKAGRTLKKNNVAIDVVALGELADNEDKLRELVDAANGRSGSSGGAHADEERTCHLVTIPAGVLPSDVLASSPILAGAGGYGDVGISVGGAGGAGAGGAGGGFDGSAFAEFGGIDPNMDPELAMALRVSMEEERVRQERVAAAAAAAAADSSESKDAEMTDASGGTNNVGGVTAEDMGLSEEEALLQQALAMSMNENEPLASTTTTSASATDDRKPPATTHDVDMQEDDDDDDAAMQMALQMSMQTEEDSSKPSQASSSTTTTTSAAGGIGGQFQDAAFVNELLGSMPGVDPNDPEIQQALRQAGSQEDQKPKDDSKKKDKDDHPDKK